VRVTVPRVRARRGAGLRLHAALLPPSIRRSTSLAALRPWLDLQGGSTGDVAAALPARRGPDAPGVSPAPRRRLQPGWHEALAQGQQRDLTGQRSVSCWGDGVSVETRLEAARHGILVRLGADASGQPDLVGLWDGLREREQSWKALLLDRQSRGLVHGPPCAMGAGAVGVWKALRHV
jgi:putative transposase